MDEYGKSGRLRTVRSRRMASIVDTGAVKTRMAANGARVAQASTIMGATAAAVNESDVVDMVMDGDEVTREEAIAVAAVAAVVGVVVDVRLITEASSAGVNMVVLTRRET